MSDKSSKAIAAPSVTVFLVTVLYNSQQCIVQFASALIEQDFIHWHLIAVDNASGDSASESLSEATGEKVSVIQNPTNTGFARAANQGICAALDRGAEFVILINNDTLIPSGFLTRFLARRDALEADVIAPRIMRLDRPEEAWYAGGHLEYGWIFRNIHEPYDPKDTRSGWIVDFASGCCLGLSRHVLKTVGLFDESFFVYWEDTDFCVRLKEACLPLHYAHDIFILHEGGHASGGERSIKFNALYWKSYMQFVRKHLGGTVAIRTMIRVSLKELGRPHKRWRRLSAISAAMAKGLIAPLVPLSSIPCSGSDEVTCNEHPLRSSRSRTKNRPADRKQF